MTAVELSRYSARLASEVRVLLQGEEIDPKSALNQVSVSGNYQKEGTYITSDRTAKHYLNCATGEIRMAVDDLLERQKAEREVLLSRQRAERDGFTSQLLDGNVVFQHAVEETTPIFPPTAPDYNDRCLHTDLSGNWKKRVGLAK